MTQGWRRLLSHEAPGDPEAYRLLYTEAVRAIEGQRLAVDELRSRSAVLLSAATLLGGFLGPQAAAKMTGNVGAAFVLGNLAGACLVLAVVVLLYVIRPTGGWRFDSDVRV